MLPLLPLVTFVSRSGVHVAAARLVVEVELAKIVADSGGSP
jgi:hypothetical protein